jgi:hypothetical protein
MEVMHERDTVSAIARQASECCETRAREDGARYVTLKDGHGADWLHELVRKAHGEFLPDDWRYARIAEALELIGESDADYTSELDEIADEFADGAVDVYTSGQLEWLSSNLQRVGYVDEATSELGHGDSVTDDIGLGQYVEAREIFASVRQSLEDRQSVLADY